MRHITLITGACRSGKSSHALRLAQSYAGPHLFVATCPVLDRELESRIRKHQAERDPNIWTTHEEQTDLAAALRQHAKKPVILIDCLTLWIGNLMHHAGDQAPTEEEISRFCQQIIQICSEQSGQLILVSNEVGWGVVPENAMARRFRDLAGRANQVFSSEAHRVFLMAAGRTLELPKRSLAQPAQPDQKVWNHGGHRHALAKQAGCTLNDILDFSANINPAGPPDWLRPLIDSTVDQALHYPDPHHSQLIETANKRWGLNPQQQIWGNGVSQILYHLPYLLNGHSLAMPTPCYSDYQRAFQAADYQIQPIPTLPENDFVIDLNKLARKQADVTILANPQNPTGRVIRANDLRALADKLNPRWLIIDEAFMDFIQDRETLLPHPPANVIILRSLTKYWCIPGLRLGFAVAPTRVVQMAITRMPPWSVNTIASAVGVRAMTDASFDIHSQASLPPLRAQLIEGFQSLPGFTIYSGEANYILVHFQHQSHDGSWLCDQLLKKHHIAIRNCHTIPGLDANYLRFAVRTKAENETLLQALASILRQKRPHSKPKPALMFQGSGSNVGKTIMTAALCRIMLQDGYRVAPFKAQNMSLNSFVTPHGEEVSRAQALQARAARLEVSHIMNPILLKPTQGKSQVVVSGQSRGTMTWRDYQKLRPELQTIVHQSYQQLASDHDVIVLEGAGSPGEVNLKAGDLVNMAMARFAQAGVVLVGDIDRGGVFASFMGTMSVLNQWERVLVKGYLVNRFRGDATLLTDAYAWLENYTGKPVFGHVPMIYDLDLPEEDGAFDFGYTTRQTLPDSIDAAVISLPHISNFTDLDPLMTEPDIAIRRVRRSQDLGDPQVIIIPGSKNTPADLAWLRKTGLDHAIIQRAQQYQTQIVGICGGYQMLGQSISDPHHVESSSVMHQGLNLLDHQTVMAPQKTLTRRTVHHQESGRQVTGYEIHHGQSPKLPSHPIFPKHPQLGSTHPQHWVWGTYLHGIFDQDRFRRWWINQTRTRLGLPIHLQESKPFDLEPALDRLADIVRTNVDIKALYRAAGL